MARRAVYRSGTFIFMATLALCVKCIGSLYRVLAVNFMTFSARRGGFPLIFKGMMTVSASDTVSGFRSMHLMIKKDIACCALEHDSNRFFWRLDRKGGITDNPHKKEYNCKAVCNDSLCFDFHIIFPLFNRGMG